MNSNISRVFGFFEWMARLVALVAISGSCGAAERPPNVVLILADDKYHDATPVEGWVLQIPWKYSLVDVVLQSVANRDFPAIAADSVELTTLCYSTTFGHKSEKGIYAALRL